MGLEIIKQPHQFDSNITMLQSLSVYQGLTVQGTISTNQGSSNEWVRSTSTLETPMTGLSAVTNIVTLSQATYDALTVKKPTTLYVIV